MTIPPTDPNWWAAWLLPIPFIGIWMKAHFAQNQRISDALEVAADATKKAAETTEKLAACRLDVEQEFASKKYLNAVEIRLTGRIEAMESNVIEALKGSR